jgi:excisionase family DNA binding protein
MQRAYSVKTLAAMFDVSESTILRLIRDGELQAWRLKTLWRIDESQVEAYKARQTWRPPQPAPIPVSQPTNSSRANPWNTPEVSARAAQIMARAQRLREEERRRTS